MIMIIATIIAITIVIIRRRIVTIIIVRTRCKGQEAGQLCNVGKVAKLPMINEQIYREAGRAARA